jgi:hypothetical protein
MKIMISAVIALFGMNAFAAGDASPGMRAFAAIAPAAQDFAAGNFRAGCKALGAYQAYKSMANPSNTDQWTLRNLNYGEESEAVLENFCEGPNSRVTKEKAAAAARSIEGNAGME